MEVEVEKCRLRRSVLLLLDLRCHWGFAIGRHTTTSVCRHFAGRDGAHIELSLIGVDEGNTWQRLLPPSKPIGVEAIAREFCHITRASL